MNPPPAIRRLEALLPASPRHRLALGLSLAVLVLAAATAPAVGVSRDEGVYFVAAESYGRFWAEAVRSPSRTLALADQRFAVNHEHPALAKQLYAATHAVLNGGLGLSHAQGYRFGAFLLAALLTFVLSLFGHDLAGRPGALLAPALFWLVPRHFYHAHPAALDMPVTALWLATVFAYRKSLLGRGDGRAYLRWSLATGALFGAAVAVKHNGWFLPPLLLAHWLATHSAAVRRGALAERLRAVPLAFPCMALLGPLVLLLAWPWLWHHPLERLREYFAFHLGHENYPWMYLGTLLRRPPFPVLYPYVVTALTVPAASLAAMAGGIAHSLRRLWLAVRGTGDASISDEVLLLVNALFPMALIAWPTVPHFGGVKHWLPAMPFLALLGARALATAGRRLWPARPALVTGALAALALVPAAWSVAHVHPFGTAAYNEIAGGAPGAASLGMQRQFWGDDMVAVLGAINVHAAPGAHVWYQEASVAATWAYQRDGRLRGDLVRVEGPEEADISVWQYHQEFRDKEFSTWTQFRTARPVTGTYLDEVPLVQVYARPGAWR